MTLPSQIPAAGDSTQAIALHHEEVQGDGPGKVGDSQAWRWYRLAIHVRFAAQTTRHLSDSRRRTIGDTRPGPEDWRGGIGQMTRLVTTVPAALLLPR